MPTYRKNPDVSRPSERATIKPGDRFQRLTVLRLFDRTPKRAIRWLCKCDCGTEIIVQGGNLKNQFGCKPCGQLLMGRKKRTHGATKGSGSSRTPLYKAWRGMLGRCKTDTEWNRWYAGKGIKVCDEWQYNFVAFRDWALTHGWQQGLSIDRINTDLGYSPDNCAWVTRTWNIKRIVNPFAEHFPIEALWGHA